MPAKTSIEERNRQILQMRREGVEREEIARRFKLAPRRIRLIELKLAAEQRMAERRVRLRERIRQADDPDRQWPVEDLVDALGLAAGTKRKLNHYFVRTQKRRISLRELLDMCSVSEPRNGEHLSPALLAVYGIGEKAFWSVVNELTRMDLGRRCNEEWRVRLARLKRHWRPQRAAPDSFAA